MDSKDKKFESEKQKNDYYRYGGAYCEKTECYYDCDPDTVIANEGCPLMKNKD